MDELLDHNRRVPKMSPIVVTEQIHRAHHMSPAQRRYTVRLRVARLDAIAKAFGTSFQVIKDAFGMHFLPKLLTKCGMVLKQSGAISSISVVTGGASKSKRKSKADADKEEEDAMGASSGGGTGKNTRADIVDIDSDDEQVKADDEDTLKDSEEQGSLRFAGKKQQVGEDEGDSSSSNESSDSDSDSDSDSEETSAKRTKQSTPRRLEPSAMIGVKINLKIVCPCVRGRAVSAALYSSQQRLC